VTTTKVTPAYPGKIQCNPPVPYDVCVKVLNGQIDEEGLRKISSATASASASSSIFGGSDSSSAFGRYTSGGYATYGKPYAGIGTSDVNFGIGGSDRYKTYGNSFGASSGSVDVFQAASAAGHGSTTFGSNDLGTSSTQF